MRIIQRAVPSSNPSLDTLHPKLAQILASRGIESLDALTLNLESLHDFRKLKDIDRAVDRLYHAFINNERIVVIGDFDADGATASALAVGALQSMGAKNIEYIVPNRFEYGYGLSPEIVALAHKKHAQLIITVDNGITSIEGVNTARELDIDVIITDHHLAGKQLPDACAIINPNQAECDFPSKSIAGVGVIFYVMIAFRRHLIDNQWFASKRPTNLAQFLDLVALGTVADVVPLDKNNRILVSLGLKRIQSGRARPGIQALLEVAKKKSQTIVESDLGFSIAPRLNAAGRLDDMSNGVRCLLSKDIHEANSLAANLDELNIQRRTIEQEMKASAIEALNRLSISIDNLPQALCLMDEGWHQGVIGILAGRLKEQYHRPVIAFAKVNEQEMKGSARSIAKLNIRDILADVNTNHPGLIKKFGGHAMAAGLSIHPDDFNHFKHAFIHEVGMHLKPEDCENVVITDGPLSQSELNLNFAELIKQSGPWGQGFPEPTFDNCFEIIEQRIVGKNHLKLSLVLQNSDIVIPAIAFNVDLALWPNYRAQYIHAVYKLDINQYNHRTNLQLIIQELIAIDNPELFLQSSEVLYESSM